MLLHRLLLVLVDRPDQAIRINHGEFIKSGIQWDFYVADHGSILVERHNLLTAV